MVLFFKPILFSIRLYQNPLRFTFKFSPLIFYEIIQFNLSFVDAVHMFCVKVYHNDFMNLNHITIF